MRRLSVRALAVSIIALAATTGVVWAASLHNITSTLGGTTGDYFDLDGVLLVDALKVGSQGVGGVTFFNGTIINNTTDEDNNGIPVTFGDDVRIDGTLFRGATQGSDGYPLKLNDDVRVYGDLTIDPNQTMTVTDVSWVGLTQDAITSPSWTGDDIADVTRRVELPLGSFFTDANGTPAQLTSATEPNLMYTANQGLHIQYSEDDTVDIGAQFTVPADYVSGGVVKAVVDTSGDIVTDWDLDYAFAISETSSTPAWDTDMDDETAVNVPDSAGTPAVVTFTPTDQADLSAGDSVFFNLFPASNTGTGEPDVEIYSLWFEYTATQ